MSTWTAGYVADLAYTHGFYRELTPALLRLVQLCVGQRSADEEAQSYCEVGCGQGFSANLLAAANPGISFYATDFNPSQIAGARRMAREAGTPNIQFFDHSFAELAAEPALPAQFDFIALHGIYSWISPENRQHIVEFIRTRLKPGGLVYISYNALPGWASAEPLRRLLADQEHQTGGTRTERIEAAIGFVERLQAVQPAYFGQTPVIGKRFDRLKGESRNYLAHEYFNRDWTPFYFADVVAELGEAKLGFVGSAHLLDQIDPVNLSNEQRKFIEAETDPMRRQSLRDYMVNQQFRRDVFGKGSEAHSTASQRARWLATRFALTTPRADVPEKVMGARGEADLQKHIYDPIADALAEGPATVQQLTERPKISGMSVANLLQALTVLTGAGHVQPCLDAEGDAARAEQTQAFNTVVCRRAMETQELQFLASPATGGGVPLERFSQLFLLAHQEGRSDAPAWVWSLLAGQNQRLLKDGKALDSAEANTAELAALQEVFLNKRLPLLERLGIA